MNPRHSVPQTDALPTELHPPSCTPGWTRTTDQRLRRPLLYPTELQAPKSNILERRDGFVFSPPTYFQRSTSQMVGARGFEPPTTSTQNWCATRLRYTPIKNKRVVRIELTSSAWKAEVIAVIRHALVFTS